MTQNGYGHESVLHSERQEFQRLPLLAALQNHISKDKLCGCHVSLNALTENPTKS